MFPVSAASLSAQASDESSFLETFMSSMSCFACDIAESEIVILGDVTGVRDPSRMKFIRRKKKAIRGQGRNGVNGGLTALKQHRLRNRG